MCGGLKYTKYVISRREAAFPFCQVFYVYNIQVLKELNEWSRLSSKCTSKKNKFYKVSIFQNNVRTKLKYIMWCFQQHKLLTVKSLGKWKKYWMLKENVNLEYKWLKVIRPCCSIVIDHAQKFSRNHFISFYFHHMLQLVKKVWTFPNQTLPIASNFFHNLETLLSCNAICKKATIARIVCF